jgi:hypothetical protein
MIQKWIISLKNNLFSIGGEKGIRTLDTIAHIHAFQACAFNHSATSPRSLTSDRRSQQVF